MEVLEKYDPDLPYFIGQVRFIVTGDTARIFTPLHICSKVARVCFARMLVVFFQVYGFQDTTYLTGGAGVVMSRYAKSVHFLNAGCSDSEFFVASLLKDCYNTRIRQFPGTTSSRN